MEGLGRAFNVVPTAAGVEVNLKDAEGVTFICVGADTYTIQEAEDGTGTNVQDLDVVGHHFTNAGAVGATAWVEADQDPADAALIVAANAAIYVDASQLSDGFTHVQCNAAATGLVVAIVQDLAVQRNPANLAVLTG